MSEYISTVFSEKCCRYNFKMKYTTISGKMQSKKRKSFELIFKKDAFCLKTGLPALLFRNRAGCFVPGEGAPAGSGAPAEKKGKKRRTVRKRRNRKTDHGRRRSREGECARPSGDCAFPSFFVVSALTLFRTGLYFLDAGYTFLKLRDNIHPGGLNYENIRFGHDPRRR